MDLLGAELGLCTTFKMSAKASLSKALEPLKCQHYYQMIVAHKESSTPLLHYSLKCVLSPCGQQ